MSLLRAANFTISKEIIQINEIKKQTNQSKPVKYINMKLIPEDAKATCAPGIYINIIITANSIPMIRYIRLLLSSRVLFIKDLLGRLIWNIKKDTQKNKVTISIVNVFPATSIGTPLISVGIHGRSTAGTGE